MTHPLSRRERRWITVVITLVLLAPLIPTVLRTTGLQGMVFRVVSPSLPQGWYWMATQDSLIVGYPTLVCYPQDVVSFGVRRGYLFPDSTRAQSYCHQTLVYVIKPIAALPGDTVTVTRDSLRVNSRPWLTAHVHELDSKDRPLPNAIGTHVLNDGECFALSLWHSRSFDSRYIGPIPCPVTPRIAFPFSPSDAAHVHRMARRIAGITDASSLSSHDPAYEQEEI